MRGALILIALSMDRRIFSPTTFGAVGSRHRNTGLIQVDSSLSWTGDSWTNELGAFVAGTGTVNLANVSVTDRGTIDLQTPALIDVTFDPVLVELRFNAEMDVASLQQLAAYQFVASGGDRGFTEGNELDLTSRIRAVSYDPETRTARLLLSSPLTSDLFRLTLDGEALRDVSNVPLIAGGVEVVDGPLGAAETRLDVTLLAASYLAHRSEVPRQELVDFMLSCMAQHGRFWRKSAREPGAAPELADLAIGQLERLHLIVRQGERLLPRPALARFSRPSTSSSPVPRPADADLFSSQD